MGALFQDLKSKLNTPKQLEPIKGIRYAEVLYADDTLIFGTYPINQYFFTCNTAGILILQSEFEL